MLQLAPAYLVDYTDKWREKDQEGRDMVALFLAQKPHSPEGYRGHSEIRFFLYQQALKASQSFGKSLLIMRRNDEARHQVRVHQRSADDVVRALQRPRSRYGIGHGFHYPEIFAAVRALGETPEHEVDHAFTDIAYASYYA